MSSIGQDLSRIRRYQKLTLQDLYKKTRISLEILKKLEDGRLFDDAGDNDVYARSYIRTYARAIGISEDLVTKALDLQKRGEYDGLLLEPWPDIIGKTTPREIPDGEEKPADSVDPHQTDQKPERTPAGRSQKETGSPSASSDPEPETDQPDGEQNAPTSTIETANPPKKGVPGAGKAKKASPSLREKKSADQIDWAAMGKRFTETSKRSSGWILGLGLVLLFVAAVLWIAFRTDLLTNLFEPEEPDQEMITEPREPETSAEADEGLGLDLESGVQADPDPMAANSTRATPTRLDSTLYITIYGAHGALDPVRVWSDLKPRFDPYWIEQGEAMQFEFRDTIRVRSQYDESLLFLNGHQINDARERYYNSAEQSVELVRGLFAPEAQWANPREFELPDSVAVPDTLRMRPIFN
ncbi:MAG: helix-turn-helix domain-containing protein [Balneolaceae bacterium]